MKINYVSYLDPFKFNGGGEMIMKSLLNYATKLGFELFFTTVSPKQNNYKDNADLTVICDVFNSPSSFEKIDSSLIKKIIEKDKYIHFDNSFVDVCNLDYLPCNGKKTEYCSFKKYTDLRGNIKRRDFSKKCFQENIIVKDMYEKSLSNIFLSPLHYKKISTMLNIEEREFFILRPTVDTNKFYNKRLERDIEYVFAGAISEAKGVENLKSYFSDKNKRVLMIGKKIYKGELGFADYTGFVDYDEMPNYFNRAKNFIYLPRWPEPQGRVVVEAALCGCNLITNENVGATSFNFDIGVSENLNGSEKEFWDYINLILS